MRIFKEDDLDRSFRAKGFVVDRIAAPSDLEELRRLYEELGRKDTGHKFYTSIWVDDAAHRKDVNDAIRDFIFPRVRDKLNDFEPVFGNFMVKHSGAGSSLGMHQDWTFVDENKCRSVNCWLQVSPASMDNGPLLLVPYSHYFSDIIRGRNITSPFDRIFSDIKREFSQPVLPEPGEAVFFDNAIMHGSDDNRTASDRIAVSLVLKPKSAPLYHYFRLPGKEKKTYCTEVAPDFYLDVGLFDDLKPLTKSAKTDTIDLRQPAMEMDEFRRLYRYYSKEEGKMAIFNDPELNLEFMEKGFVVFPGFLTADEIAHLRKFYEENPLPGAKGFHASSHSREPDYKRRVHEEITRIMAPKTKRLLKGYRPLTSSYTVKEPSDDSFFESHLDWNMVDESDCISITLWCALMDTNEVNGNIYMLERSHTLGPTVRSGKGLYLHALNDNYKSAKFIKRDLKLKAGDMVLYDHRVFHGSPANKSGEARISFNHAMIPDHVTSVHYSQEKAGVVDIYEVDDDFYNRYEIGTRPADVRHRGILKVKKVPVSQEEVNKMIVHEEDI